ncbi:MAG: group II intron reverse transcriptase/maturase [Lentisphaeraceae bacterium]|nr:group II intron reverse transcriptase/maturase [Lentisphaeraceae bacterium]
MEQKREGIVRVVERSIQTIATPLVWTNRMLNALSNGVKRGKWYSLYDKVYSALNLDGACEHVLLNKGKPGVDSVTVSCYEKQRLHNLKTLQEELRDNTYKPKAIRRVYIPKAGSYEKRPLGIPTVRDRIVQTALKNVIEPIFDVDFSERSFGFRKGLGCKDALRTVMTELRDDRKFIVDADIKSYFDEIDHDLLLELVAEKISDKKILQLIKMFLKQGIMENMKYYEASSGSPQGGVISPLLANIFLDPLDKLLEEHGLQVIRYADDFVIMCKSQAEAKNALETVKDWMKSVKLRLHPQKTRIVDMNTRGSYFEFLGYHFEHSKRGNFVRWPRSSSLKKIRNTIRHITKRNSPYCMEEICARLRTRYRGWFEYFKHSNESTFTGLDGFARRRMRRIQKKRNNIRGAGRNVTDHRRWPNVWFESRGYVSLHSMFKAEVQSLRSNH